VRYSSACGLPPVSGKTLGGLVNIPKLVFGVAIASIVAVVAVAIVIAVSATFGEPLRGDSEPSPDGKTYLAVMDRNKCAALRVDGRPWPYEEGVRRAIAPGVHRIACGGESGIEFMVREGDTFNFDYWGP